MRLIRPAIILREDVLRAADRACHVAALEHHAVAGLLRAHRRVDAVAARQHRRNVPRDFQVARGAHRVPFRVRHHADEIAFAQHARAGDVGDRTLVDARHLRARAVRRLPARPHDAPVDHPRQPQVLDVDVLAAHFIRDVVAHAGARPPACIPTRASAWPSR